MTGTADFPKGESDPTVPNWDTKSMENTMLPERQLPSARSPYLVLGERRVVRGAGHARQVRQVLKQIEANQRDRFRIQLGNLPTGKQQSINKDTIDKKTGHPQETHTVVIQQELHRRSFHKITMLSLKGTTHALI